MATRLDLLCPAATPSVRSVAFAVDEPLDAPGLRSLGRLPRDWIPAHAHAVRSPALCAAQTADAFGLEAEVAPALRDCDFGRWSGLRFEDVRIREPDALARWLEDPGAAPHGGESFEVVLRRVAAWLDGQASKAGSLVAITHPTIIRASVAHALGAGARCFGCISVTPLTRVRLTCDGSRWALAALLPFKDAT